MDKGRAIRKQRTATWEYPPSGPGATLTGMEYLKGLRDGRIPRPPVWCLIGYRLMEVEVGRALLRMDPEECHYNRFGWVQGGVICSVLDAAMACAISSVLPPAMTFTSPEIKVEYFRPLDSGTGPLSCEGRIVDRADPVTVLEARLTDQSGRLYARAVSSFMVVEKR